MQTTGLKRNSSEKFYTCSDVARTCLEQARHILNFSEDALIIEPSAGNGSFIPFIKQCTSNYICYDIHPEHDEIIQCDFLNIDTKQYEKYKKVHVIGNPPFGRQSHLAGKFIRKCSEFSDSISFILPKSFKKESMQNRYFPLQFHLVFQMDIEPNSFLVEGVVHDVPCIFQIWKKNSHSRTVSEKLEPVGFQFVKSTDSIPKVAFRRVGANAGRWFTHTDDKSSQSHYFIHFNKWSNELFDTLNSLVFNDDNTVGPRSISKQELISKVNSCTTY